jgi:hypothetical protein
VESKKQELCEECWKEKLEGCNNGSVQTAPCAFGKCPNDSEREVERIHLQTKTKIPQLYWRRCYGWATSAKGTKYPVMSIATHGHVGMIVVLGNGRLAVKQPPDFGLQIDSYYDDRI